MKYIVYKTTNLVNNYIYIGVHHTNDDGKFDFYLGNGIDIRKSSSYEKAKTKFQQAVKEFGPANFRRETIAIFDDEYSAYDLEGQIVNEEFLARPDVYNMILGGRINHCLGIKVFQYDINGNYLSEYKSFQDAANNLRLDSTSIRTACLFKLKVLDKYYFSTDKLDKLDLSLYNNIVKKRVFKYSKLGEYLGEFESYNAAGRDINAAAAGIMRSSTLGTCVKQMYYYCPVKADSYDKARKLYIESRPVHKYDSEGNYLESYESQLIAKEHNIGSNITKAIKLKSPDYNGFLWSLDKLPTFNSKKIKHKRPVAQIDDSGNIIKTWESANKAVKEMGAGVLNVLFGKYKKHKGFIYKFID